MSGGACSQPTAIVWCERSADDRRSGVSGSFDDRRSGVSGSFDDRRPSSRRTTIVVPTKIA